MQKQTHTTRTLRTPPLPTLCAPRSPQSRGNFNFNLNFSLSLLIFLAAAVAAAVVLAHPSVMSAASPFTEAKSPSRGSSVLQTSAPPRGWVDEGPLGTLKVDPGAPAPTPPPLLHFRVLLRQNRAQLDAVFQDVSDPRSAKYGHHLTADQVRELVSPSLEDQHRVAKWLRHGLRQEEDEEDELHVQSLGDAIAVDNAAPKAVERLFGCVVHRFREEEPAAAVRSLQEGGAPRVVHRCVGAVRIPSELEGLVTGTQGLVDFPLRGIRTGPHPHPFRPHEDERQPQPGAQPTNPSLSTLLPQRHNPIPLHQGIAHPHTTLRSVDQLRHVAQEFDREQLERRR